MTDLSREKELNNVLEIHSLGRNTASTFGTRKSCNVTAAATTESASKSSGSTVNENSNMLNIECIICTFSDAICEDKTVASLNVSVVGPGPLSCRWQRHEADDVNGEDCTGIDEPTFTITQT